MSDKEWVQIPKFRCGGMTFLFDEIIKDLEKSKKYEIINDSSNITIKKKKVN